jgi:DmsE family decaheme c-type cytochrome
MRILMMLLVTVAAAAQDQASPPAAGSGFVGSNACKTCHADVWMNFYKNPHYKSIASGQEPEDKTGCEGCHGPAQKHVEASGGKATIPRAFSLMQPKQVLDACLGCHARDLARANIQRSEHTKNLVACTGCHSIHHSPTPKYLLGKKQNELCYGCHATVRAQSTPPGRWGRNRA